MAEAVLARGKDRREAEVLVVAGERLDGPVERLAPANFGGQGRDGRLDEADVRRCDQVDGRGRGRENGRAGEVLVVVLFRVIARAERLG